MLYPTVLQTVNITYKMWSDCSFRSPSLTILIVALVFFHPSTAQRPWRNQKFNVTELILKHPESDSSKHVSMKYHNGVVFTSDITLHLIWYGYEWVSTQKRIIRGFLNSISATNNPRTPSVSDWWNIVTQYTDKNGNHVSKNVKIGSERNHRDLSFKKNLTRGFIEHMLTTFVGVESLSDNPYGAEIYLFFTDANTMVPEFCRGFCAYHGAISKLVDGKTLPYVWVGNPERCDHVCAYPFALPYYDEDLKPLIPPNGNLGMDAMVGNLATEIVDLLTNPFRNGWYSATYTGTEETQNGVGFSCARRYGRNSSGFYPGDVIKDKDGASYNVHGLGRRFLLPLVWSNLVNDCSGPEI